MITSLLRFRRSLWATPLLGLALAASACGGGSTTTSSPATSAASSSATTAGGGAASNAAFVSCMTKNGIPASAVQNFRGFGGGGGGGFGGGSGGSFPSGSFPQGSAPSGSFTRPTVSLPAGVTQTQYRTALQACRADLPNRGGFGGAFGNSAAAQAYRNCLQLNGVTLPSRSATGTAPSTPPSTVNFNSPTYQHALQACAALRPKPTSSSTTTSTTA